MFAMPVMQPGGDCSIDIVDVLVRVPCPKEIDRLTDRYRHTETDRLRQTDRDRPAPTTQIAASHTGNIQ